MSKTLLSGAILVAAIIILGISITAYSSNNPSTAQTNPIPSVVSAQETTYHLGDLIMQTDSDRYFFHGITCIHYHGDYMLIGHQTIWGQGSVWSSQYSAMSNIELSLRQGDTFQLQFKQFRVVEYGHDWITLAPN